MKAILMFAALTLMSGSLQAQQPLVGRATTTQSDPGTVSAMSFDRQWTVKGFLILDAQGNVVLTWRDSGAVWRESITVSWAPDSAHVVLLDQAPRAAEFYCAELRNGKWENVPIHIYDLGDRKADDLKMPKLARVTKAQLLDWISPMMVEIKMNHMVDEPFPSHQVKIVEYITSLRFENNEVYFAAQ